MDKTLRICPGCGAPLPDDALPGPCPHCRQPPGSDPSAGAARPRPGEVFGGYRIRRLLGRGGMGEVFEAEQLDTGRLVALKVMGHTFGSEEDRKRFLREARLAASINHPHVVYVHGGAEVQQTPVIAMELARGGTLSDRLRQAGPLPVTEAVEAMLQVIAGLEAAHAAGVLHRDIKPSNCFVSADGAIKIGDFGLAVNTLARGDSLLTATGTWLGTPAYASPEQLRGEELTVASDIYSVGATLYHLLTARLPFASSDMVRLITEVLDKPPPPPNSLRPDLPEALSRIILRCLAKEPKARFASYAELRDALLPFTRAEAEPARPAPRAVAGLVDSLIAWLPAMLSHLYWGQSPQDTLLMERTWTAALMWLPLFLWGFGYWVICEGHWGAGLGKALLGLRVVNQRGDVPGLPRAAARTLLFLSPELLPALVALLFLSAGEYRIMRQHDWLGWSDTLGAGLFLLLYATLWKRFGYVALLDRLSGTRVIVRPKTQRRPALRPAECLTPTPPPASPAALPAFGYFRTLACLWHKEAAGEALYLAEDPVLRRQVWVHVRPATAPAVSLARRELARPGRLRWLCGGTLPSGLWDAYDAVAGAALTDLGRRPRAWAEVRFWLLDLAVELDACLKELELPPPLALNRLWISRAGNAVWLEFPAPAAAPVESADAVIWPLDGPHAAQKFLDAMARRVLEPRHLPLPAPTAKGVRAPVPLHARGFLDSLPRASFDRMEYVLGNLRSLAGRDAVVSRVRRGLSIFLVPAAIVLLSGIILVASSLEYFRWQRAWRAEYGNLPSLRGAVTMYRVAQQAGDFPLPNPPDEALARAFIVGHYASLINNAAFWENRPLASAFTEQDRQLLKEVVNRQPPPEAALVERAKKELSGTVAMFDRASLLTSGLAAAGFLILAPLLWGALELVSALVAGKARVVDLAGMAVVNSQGERASRWRLFWRWGVVWFPLILMSCLFIVFFLTVQEAVRHPQTLGLAQSLPFIAQLLLLGVAGAALLALAAAIYAVWRPERGLQDRLAGTWIVLK